MHTHHTDESSSSASAVEAPVNALAEARRLLAEDERARVEMCAQEIAAVLAKYGMHLETTPSQVVLAPVLLPEVEA